MVMVTRYNPWLVMLSILVASLASYVALDLSNSVSRAEGKARLLWLACGAVAMGLGIWSMHFVGMLAFEMRGMSMAYDVPLMLLSILVAIGASAIALYVTGQKTVPVESIFVGGVAMAAAIAGMHYIGMHSMRMAARIEWNPFLVTASVVIALVASFAALLISIRLRSRDFDFRLQLFASIVMGLAISGMHYTGMEAATFIHIDTPSFDASNILATDGLAVAVTVTTLVILAVALIGSIMDRAFWQSSIKAQNAELAVTDLECERELRERFVSALAHDLRTPLAAAKMSAQLAIRKADQQESVEKFCSKAVASLTRMDQMIQDLLDASRISAGRSVTLSVESCSLQDLLKTTLDDLTTVHGNRFTLVMKENTTGFWDPQYLRRAIENLCTNAVKYGKPDGAIKVAVTNTKLGNNQAVAISVHNLGEPLAERDKARLFSLFHRGLPEKTAHQHGWGLGLTIVKGVAEAHGGNVKVDSTQAGTTFTVEIPVDARPYQNRA